MIDKNITWTSPIRIGMSKVPFVANLVEKEIAGDHDQLFGESGGDGERGSGERGSGERGSGERGSGRGGGRKSSKSGADGRKKKKIVVWFHHIDVCKALEKEFNKIHPPIRWRTIRGITTSHERKTYLNEFESTNSDEGGDNDNSNSSVQVLLLSIMACSTGLNLGFCNLAIFSEMWPCNAQQMQQAERRLVRTNSTHTCAKQIYIVVENQAGRITKDNWLDLDNSIWAYLCGQLDKTVGMKNLFSAVETLFFFFFFF